jgi:hypothetical protein
MKRKAKKIGVPARKGKALGKAELKKVSGGIIYSGGSNVPTGQEEYTDAFGRTRIRSQQRGLS